MSEQDDFDFPCSSTFRGIRVHPSRNSTIAALQKKIAMLEKNLEARGRVISSLVLENRALRLREEQREEFSGIAGSLHA